jgi:hypothetical protein
LGGLPVPTSDIEAVVLTPEEQRKSTAGRKPTDSIVLYKMLVLQSLYKVCDAQIEYQVCDLHRLDRIGLHERRASRWLCPSMETNRRTAA